MMSSKRKQKEKQLQVSNGKSSLAGPSTNDGSSSSSQNRKDDRLGAEERAVLAEEHLAPLPLVFTILACSGFLWVLGFRDVMGTGRIILGEMDEAYLDYTRSRRWFDDSMGWKSKQGGLSVIQQVTTDANDMGGLFVRKMEGAAMMGVAMHKLLPVLVHPSGAQWKRGHFRPMLIMSVLANFAVAIFLASQLDDLVLAGADLIPKAMMGALAVETATILFYFASVKVRTRGPAIVMTDGRTEKSIPSRIVLRTVLLISTAMTIIAGRDLFFPGYILDYIPRDDIYLEWTGAFIHSPPEDSIEADDQGIEAPFHAGEKFVSQFMALHVLILCLYKFGSSALIRYGSDGGGMIRAKLVWMASAVGDFALLVIFRLFAPAAKSASLDLRWHLMCVAYEGFILAVFAYL